MQQYIYEDRYRGQPRKLLIVIAQDGQEYRVFSGADFLGSIRTEQNPEGPIWKTEYNVLKPIAAKIGEHIESLL